MTALEARLSRLDPAPVSADASKGKMATEELAGVGRGEATSHTGVFRRDGEYWTIGFGGDSFRLHDAKGLRYLARLLAVPGREIHVLDLVAAERDPQAVVAGDGRPAAADIGPPGFGDAGEVLDAQARDAYRERLTELEGEIAEAEGWNDPERISRLRVERDLLVQELAASLGLGGRSRVVASAAERARLSVGKAIRAAMHRIETHSRPLGRHLAVSVHTGTFCSYTPDPTLSITWEL